MAAAPTTPTDAPVVGAARSKPSTGDSLDHVHCCQDTDVMLCGARFAGPADAEDVNCVVCLDLEANADDYCPLGGTCIQAVAT